MSEFWIGFAGPFNSLDEACEYGKLLSGPFQRFTVEEVDPESKKVLATWQGTR